MVDDDLANDDDGCSREQAVAIALEAYIRTLMSDAASPWAIRCSALRGETGAACDIHCTLHITDEDISPITEVLARELCIQDRSVDTVSEVIYFTAIIPAITPDVDKITTQLFGLEVRGGCELPEELHLPPSTIPVAVDPNYGRARDEYEHVIVLVHGIKDIGAWQNKVSRQLNHPGTTVKQIRYGLYPAVRFLFPINLSRGAVKRVIDGLSDIHNEYRKAKISVIAHSFGTYVLLKALDRDPNLELWKIVFCGSVADDRLRWANFKHRIGDRRRPTSDFVVNDCGTGDIWPVMGASFGWHYGMAGATGFSEELVKNRFHRATGGTKGGHGLYFAPEFVSEKWRPFLIEDAAPLDGDGEQGEHIPPIVRILYHAWARWICRCVMLALWLTVLAVAAAGIWWAAAWVFARASEYSDDRPVLVENANEIAELNVYVAKFNGKISKNNDRLLIDLSDCEEVNNRALNELAEILMPILTNIPEDTEVVIDLRGTTSVNIDRVDEFRSLLNRIKPGASVNF